MHGPLSKAGLSGPACRAISVGATCTARALGDESYYVSYYPHFSAIRAEHGSLFQNAEGSMHLFMRHNDHCLTAILQIAQT